MRDYLIGKRTRRLTEADEGVSIWSMELEPPEAEHMACVMEEGLYVLAVDEGSLFCQVDQERFQISQGEGLFIGEGSLWRFLGCGKEGCRLYLMEMPDDFLRERMAGFPGWRHMLSMREDGAFFAWKLRDEKEEEAEAILAVRAAGQTAEAKEECYELDLFSWLFSACSALCRAYARAKPKCTRASAREREKLQGMVRGLHAHYREKRTLSQLAEECGVSEGDYCRFFKKHLGQTPFEYLQQYRIIQSIPQLLEKKGGLKEAALSHGFSGASYYAEIFRKEMGCAPGEYRKWYFGTEEACPLSRKERFKREQKNRNLAGAVRREKPAPEKAMPAHLL
ncbi:MAG: AraC family transcriptional regulator [Eubacteriales bacterium]|nr:AraC family transcriptional regulator [Eubacteriales bacterium]